MFLAFLLMMSSAFATVPWSDPTQCGRHVGLNENGKLVTSFSMYSWYANALKETIRDYAKLHKDPDLKLSLEHLQFTLGYFKVIRAVDYAPTCNDFEPLDAPTQALVELQKERKLTPADFRGPQWIHMVSGIDKEEVGCINYRKVGTELMGCGDIWQGGLTEDEVVCYEGKNIPKCYVDCLADIYSHQAKLQPGFCP